MNLSIELEKKFNLSKVKFDLSKQINMFAGSVVLDHKNRLKYGQDVYEKPMKKLSGSTIQSKRNKGMRKPRVPLYGKGVMLNVYPVQRATKTKPLAIIIPPKKRKEVASYHQNGTKPYVIKSKTKLLGPIFTPRGDKFFAKKVNHPGLPKREWFGITVKQEKKGLKLIELEIDRILKNA